MNKQKILKLFLIALTSLFATCSFALTANNGQNFKIYDTDDLKVGLGLQVSLLEGDSREMVYYTGIGQKISELDWDLDDVVMGGGVISVAIKNKLYINFGMWDKMKNSDGYMNDSDWLSYGDPETRTHFSRSKTSLDKGSMLDVNAAYTFISLKGDEITSRYPEFMMNSTYTVQGIIGYKYDEFKWTANGGYYIYNTGTSYGMFDYEPGITYEHDLSVPYCGIAFNFNNNNIGINTFFLYSKWADIDDVDTHHWRDLRYKDSFDDAQYTSYGINLNWEFISDWSVIFSYQHENLQKVRGDTEVIYLDGSGAAYLYPYDAGFSHKNNSYSLSVSYKFL